MVEIKNVVVAGASGDLGTPILNAIIASNLFNVTVFTRNTSNAEFPASVTVKKVDYTSVADLTAALEGQDAVVSTLTTGAMETQLPLTDACIAAGVKRFIPSEFSSDISNPNTSTLPVYQPKLAVQRYLEEKASKHLDFTYSLIRNGVFLDWALAYGFYLDFNSETPRFYDGGDRPCSTTSLDTIGKAVVAVLTHFSETKNRAVYVHDMILTQRQVLEVAQKLAPEKKWNPVSVSTADAEAQSREHYRNGNITMESSMGFLARALFGEGYGGAFKTVDNEVLGLPFKTEADLEELVKGVLAASQ